MGFGAPAPLSGATIPVSSGVRSGIPFLARTVAVC